MAISEKYVKVYSKIKELGEMLELMKPSLLIELENAGGKIETELANISTTTTNEYKFSREVDQKEKELKVKQAELKALKDYEVKTNKAKIESTKTSPRITLKK